MDESQYLLALQLSLDIINESRYKPGSPNRFMIDDVYELICKEALREFNEALNEPPKQADGFVYWGEFDNYSRKFDLPAMITDDGVKTWYLNGKIGRENNMPHRTYPCGSYMWFHRGYAECVGPLFDNN